MQTKKERKPNMTPKGSNSQSSKLFMYVELNFNQPTKLNFNRKNCFPAILFNYVYIEIDVQEKAYIAYAVLINM